MLRITVLKKKFGLARNCCSIAKLIYLMASKKSKVSKNATEEKGTSSVAHAKVSTNCKKTVDLNFAGIHSYKKESNNEKAWN